MEFLFLFILIINLLQVVVGQQVHTHTDSTRTDYHQKNDDRQLNPTISSHKSSYSSFEQRSTLTTDEQTPVRWRTQNLDKLNYESTNNYIESKHEELRRRTIRMRTLTTQQNSIRKEMESNETMLTEQIRSKNPELRNIQYLITSIRDCMLRWERIQSELQKLYRDQIQEEKSLLDFYKINRPADLDSHQHIKIAIERWELIYNQLLEMQLNEKLRNNERERTYDKLLNELDFKINDNRSSNLDSSYHYSFTTQPSRQIIYSANQQQQKPFYSSSISSSSSSYSSSGDQQKSYSFSNSAQSTGLDPNHQNVIFKSNPNGYLNLNQPTIKTTSNQDEEANSLIFRRPESAALKDIKCLSKWFEDLGKEDADWIQRNQLQNEKLFEELVRLQKAQWDQLLVEHNTKKDQHLPRTFKCAIKNKELCDQEEENFNRMFNEYHGKKLPTKLDQQIYSQSLVQQNQQRQPMINYPNQQRQVQQISYHTNN